jgi:EAL domain-containing protein (putative c-di-GMP-specific phosphodiesterase class I)
MNWDFPPHLLEIEITESVIMESVDLISEKLRLVQALGVTIALDDFGTGYSSLAYLKNIPISTLKVDKLFIDDITDPDSEINLADTIIDLGHKMKLTIVAEGVETADQVAYLKKNGCDKIQGYFYSKPIPAGNLDQWLSALPN